MTFLFSPGAFQKDKKRKSFVPETIKNNSKATGAGQTWSGFEKRPQYLSIKTAKQIMEIMFLLPDSCINMFFHY